ncbi:putative uncharacterized protein MYH16 [Manis javanica]|nr:putative uncharacterized protein MYH16 [Manis javanica]
MEIPLDDANKKNSKLVKTLQRLPQQMKAVIWEEEKLITKQAILSLQIHREPIPHVPPARIKAWTCRTVEELQREQDHCMHLQRIKKKNEITIKDLQAEMEEAEQLKGGKHRIVKPEAKLRAALS